MLSIERTNNWPLNSHFNKKNINLLPMFFMFKEQKQTQPAYTVYANSECFMEYGNEKSFI